MKQTPTRLTLAELRKTCDAVQVVEVWNSFARIRQDLFGFIDILAIRGEETIAIQATSWSNVSARVKKIAENDNIGSVRKAGWTVLVYGWRKKKGSRGYEVKIVDLS